MSTNPYAPPRAAVADRSTAGAVLKYRGILAMIALTFVTLGLYYVVWYFRRRTALNRLDSPTKLQLWPILLFTGVNAVDVFISIASAPLPPEEVVGLPATIVLTLAKLAAGILLIVQNFRIKTILEDHLAPSEGASGPAMFNERVSLSGIATFFLSIYYLQYIINMYLDTLQPRTAEVSQ
jgi:hypothetical protein